MEGGLLTHFITVATPLVLLVYIIVKEYRSNTSTLRRDINNDYVERNNQLEEKLKIFEIRLQEVSVQMAKLEATIVEKDRHIDSLTKLIENRNPDLVKVLDDIKTFMKVLHKMIAENNKTCIENNDVLHHQTEMLDKQKEREQNIDRASETHTGNLTRINKIT